jgi:transposase
MLQLKEKLSQYWHNIQQNLFPWLAEELGPLSEKQRQLITVLEMTRVEEFIQSYRGYVGRPQDDRTAIARAFVAKAVYSLSTTRQLLDRLKTDKALRRICGWERLNAIAKEWTFSRAFAEFSQSALPARVHEALIKDYQSERLVGHISRDSTAIEAREKPIKKKKVVKIKQKAGRPRKGEERPLKELKRLERQPTMSLAEMVQDLPTACDVGKKKDANGFHTCWKGYKLHMDVADGAIPISCILTSASLADSQVALPLAEMTAGRVVNLYDVMDAAYDATLIRAHSISLGHVPLIDFNRKGENKPTFAPHEAQRYKERSTVERVNGRLKDEYGAMQLRVRGHAKVFAHLMFGMIALTVDQLIRFVT